ncbi:MAG: hypothetical protein U1E93_11960 [Alphaproteobacteria bacterium]
MEKEIKGKLDEIFARHKEGQQRIAEAQDAAKRDCAEFLAQFKKVREAIIRPAMEEIKSYVEQKGYRASISEEEDKESDHRFGSDSRASIQLAIYPGESGGHDRPCFTATCDKHSKKVSLHERTMWGSRGGHAGGAGEFSLPEVTEKLLQEKMLKWLSEIFR